MTDLNEKITMKNALKYMDVLVNMIHAGYINAMLVHGLDRSTIDKITNYAQEQYTKSLDDLAANTIKE